MAQPVIEFRNVSVTYRRPERRIKTLKEWAIQQLFSRERWRELNALKSLTFTIEPGTAIGVIGPNGAGKSTLLRVAGGILTPTQGVAIIRGRLAPIIELGTGFEAELSGRENIFFNGALLGRSRAEMQDRLDDIVAFSGLGDFIDAPIRTYSTGMVVRLAFAIATTVDADILLLDEVLAVGDEAFRHKCRRRIQEFRDRGVTILFVSHDLDAVQEVCDHAMWLDQGTLRAMGPTAEVVAAYLGDVAAARAAGALAGFGVDGRG